MVFLACLFPRTFWPLQCQDGNLTCWTAPGFHSRQYYGVYRQSNFLRIARISAAIFHIIQLRAPKWGMFKRNGYSLKARHSYCKELNFLSITYSIISVGTQQPKKRWVMKVLFCKVTVAYPVSAIYPSVTWEHR